MTPEIASVLTRVSEEIEVQLGLLERHGLGYAQRYAEMSLTSTNRTPAQPAGLHPYVARMVREATLDELMSQRRA